MPKTLLLADASQTTQRIVDLALAGRDVRVVAVDDGLRAVELIEQEPPDLVLADVSLPGCSGYELAQALRERPNLRHIPVLLLAGLFDGVDPGQAHRVGADGILTKPLDTAVLVGRVEELLANGRPSAAAVHPAALLRTGWGVGTTEPDEVPTVDLTDKPDASDVPAAALDLAAADVDDVPAEPVASPIEPDTKPDVPEPVAAAEPESADYFAQIDQQFEVLARTPRPPLPPAEEPEFDDLDDEAPAATPVVPQAPPVVAPAPPVALTDAFAALLDAERGGGTPLPAVGPRPVAPAPLVAEPPAAAPAIDLDRLADQIAARVLAQLSDRIVRETVRDLVSDTTERLVREEIERIKQHIK